MALTIAVLVVFTVITVLTLSLSRCASMRMPMPTSIYKLQSTKLSAGAGSSSREPNCALFGKQTVPAGTISKLQSPISRRLKSDIQLRAEAARNGAEYVRLNPFPKGRLC